MMKNSFQKSNFLYYAIILVSVLVEVVIIWQLERLIPLIYPGFIGFLVFHVLYHLFLFLVAKRSGSLDQNEPCRQGKFSPYWPDEQYQKYVLGPLPSRQNYRR